MEIERSRVVPAAAARVFEVAADVSRLPSWLPGVELAERVEPLMVHVAGSQGGGYDGDALFRADREQLRVEWGSRGKGSYAGWLQVRSRDDASSEVNLHLSFLDELDEAYRGGRAGQVEAELEEALDRLARLVSSA